MSESEKTAPDPKPASSGNSAGKMFTRGLVAAALLIGVGNIVLMQAHLSAPLDSSGLSMKVQAVVVSAVILVLTLLLPVGAGSWLLRTLKQRGVKIKIARTLAALTGAWNVVLLIGLTQISPPADALEARGTWLFDALSGRGPFGEAAVPTVKKLVDDALAENQVGALAPMVTNEAAAGLAMQWLVALEAGQALRKPGDPMVEKTARLLGKYDIDLKAVKDDPATGGEALIPRGRALLRDVDTLIATARAGAPPEVQTAPTYSWTDTLTSAGRPVTMSELEGIEEDFSYLVLDHETVWVGIDETGELGFNAVYEDDEWRLQLGTFEDLVKRTMARLDRLDPLLTTATHNVDAGAATNAATPTPEPVPAADDHPAVRQAFLHAAEGRYGMMTETTAFHATWAESLTHEAAVDQAERFRAWCAASAGNDLVFAEDHKNFAVRYGLGDPELPVTNALRARLTVRGRDYLADVLKMCAPIVRLRQAADAKAGNPVSDKRRMNWAEQDARALAGRAVIAEVEPGRATIEANGRTIEAVMQDGAWRVQWAD